MTTPREQQLIERLRAATLALRDTLDERDALLRRQHEPIAVVGMACRFPGGADDVEAYWELLDSGRDAIGPLAPRWELLGAEPSAAAPRWAGLLTSSVEEFDPMFFGISPREALSLDPQQRLLLEVSWEALEDAGIPVVDLAGSRTGVFVGATNTDYARLVSGLPLAEQDAYSITGNMLSVAAGRLSYTLGFQGPCMTIDTVCSSSLVTVHLACQSLRTGDCELALAGGVNLILSAETMDGVERTQALSPDGRCKTFDALANGFARGEGCGLVVLERLSDAQRHGHRVLALIRGSAINHDGTSTGLTAPNVRAQEAMLRAALASARAEASDVGFVETHGTGTSLGDPIEIEALRTVLGAPRPDGTRCVLGAVKTNLGHLEAAAGVAGLIKAVLVLERERIPKNLHFRALNPRIRLDDSALALATEPVAWPRGERPRLAGVSSFGLSGTNAHVVVEEGPKVAARPSDAAASPRPAEIFVLSARSPAALAAVSVRLQEHLAHGSPVDLRDLAFSLATTRSALEHRVAFTAATPEALTTTLGALARGETPPGASRAHVRPGGGALAFLFTGQGSQTVGMGRALLEAWPAFRAAFERCAALFDAQLPRPLTEVMWAEPGTEAAARLDDTLFTQPALFTLQHALVELWRSWGVEPGLVAGHSIGELSAACAAGVFSLEDGVRLVAARGRAMQRLPEGGAMVSIAAREDEVREAIAAHVAYMSIAAINGPEQVVISGPAASVHAVAEGFAARGRRTRALPVSHAFHSPLIDPMLDELAAVAASIAYHAPTRPVISCVTGTLAGPELVTAEYWVRHAREAVRFGDGVRALHGAGARTFAELGPRPALLASVPACLPGVEPRLAASMRSGKPEPATLLEALGSVWLGGHAIDWAGVFGRDARRVPLPRYPWQRRRCWPAVSERPPQVGAYYDELARSDALADGRSEIDGGERYLTFAPFDEPVPGFSWLLATSEPQAYPEQARKVLEAQRRMRAVLFGRVDLASCADVLDFGCGYSTDLLVLAQAHPHLRLHGHTISAEQASIGAARVRRAGLQDRVEVLHRDSAKGPYARDYDLVFGIEVACHVRDKASLFSHVGTHLRAGGALVLADFVSNLSSDIEHEEAGSFLATAEHWARVLAQAGLRLSECIDVSPQIANFLADDQFEANLERVRAGGGIVAAALRSYDQLSRLLQRQLASYVLMTARRVDGVDAAALRELERDNRRALAERVAYAERAAASRADDERFLELTWERAPVPAPAVSSGRWLILGEGDGLGAALGAALRQAGHATTVVAKAAANPAEARRLLAHAFDGAAPTAVIDLGALAAAPGTEADAVDATLAASADGLLAVLQAMPALRWRDPPRLWLVTRGAAAVASADVTTPLGAVVTGLGRVIAMEHAELRCARVDLDPGRPAGEVKALVDELLADEAEEEIALRGEGERRVARLVRRPPTRSRTEPPIRRDGAYLVTGGLGGLGLRLAGWLAERGAGHLVLIGRRGLVDDETRAAVAALEARGSKVSVIAADVTQRPDLERVLAAVDGSAMPLRGIVHAAGVADPAMLTDLTPARMRRVLAPKVRGALLLDALTRDAPLDFFVLYASVSGLFGLAGTGSYAAANAVLDALAHHRHAAGRPGLAIDWGIFEGVGLAAGADERKVGAYAAGMRGMTVEEGHQALARLLASDRVQVGVTPFDVSLWIESYPVAAASRRLSPLRTSSADVGVRRGDPRLLDALARDTPAARAARIQQVVCDHAAYVLRLPVGELDLETPLHDLGMDSLMGLELRNRLEVSLGVEVASTLLWTYPTVASLGMYLASLFGDGRADADAPAEDATLSLEDAERLIDEEFEALP